MINKIEVFYPNKLGKALVITGFVICIVSSLMKELTDNFNIIWFLVLLGFLGLVIASSSLIIFGIRATRFYGFSKKQIITPIFGVFICVCMVILNTYLHYVSGEIERIVIGEDKIVELKEGIESGAWPADKRVYASQLYASRMYTHLGIFEKHTATDGNLVDFKPSDEDEESRNLIIELKRVTKHNRDNNIYSIYVWLATLLISLVLGLKTPMHRGNTE